MLQKFIEWVKRYVEIEAEIEINVTVEVEPAPCWVWSDFYQDVFHVDELAFAWENSDGDAGYFTRDGRILWASQMSWAA